MDSKLKIQQLVDNYTSIYDSADGVDNADPALAMDDYQALGLNNVDSTGRAKLLGSVLDQKTAGDVDSYTELQAIADAADRVFDFATDTTGTQSLSIADLTALGVINVNSSNIQQIRALLKANAADESVYDTLPALQQIVNQGFSVTVANFTGEVNSQGDYGGTVSSSNYDINPEVTAIGNTGAYLLVWQDHTKINILRVEADGSSPLGSIALDIADVTDNKPNLASLNDSGDFVVSWYDVNSNIYFAAYNSSMQQVVSPVLIHQANGASTYELDIAVIDTQGTSVVVWQSGSTVYSRKITADGTMQEGEGAVSTLIGPKAYYVKVASAGVDGSYIITASQYVDGKSQIYVQKFNADGSTQQAVFLDADSSNAHADEYSSISMLGSTGEFVVAFSAIGSNGGFARVYTQKFASDGTKLGGLLVLGHPTDGQGSYDTAISEIGTSGEYVVVWTSNTMTQTQVYSQKINADGTTTGNDLIRFDSNSELALSDSQPSVSKIGSDGDYVISWTASLPNSAGTHVYTQRVSAEGNLLTTWIGGGDIDIATALDSNLVADSYKVEFGQGQLWANNVEYVTGETVTAANWLNVKLKGLTDATTYDLTITVTTTDVGSGPVVITTQPYDMSTPLILDLNNNGIETLSVDEGILFDIDADGIVDHTGWVGKNDGLLVRDLNGDGIINDASELFGEHNLLADGTKAKDGYAALAALDSNGDGLINTADDKFADLQVWVDANSDGITQAGELLTLQQAGVRKISLTHQQTDIDSNGNTIGLLGSYTNTDGEQQQLGDVWFKYQAGTSATGSLTATASANIVQHNIDSPVTGSSILAELQHSPTQAVSVKAGLLAEYASLFAEFTSLAAKAALQPSAIVTEYLGSDFVGIDENPLVAEGNIQPASHLFPLLEPSGDPADERELWLNPAEFEVRTLDDILEDVEQLTAAIDDLYNANSSAELFEGLTDSQQGTPLEMATFSISENAEDLITIPRNHNDYE